MKFYLKKLEIHFFLELMFVIRECRILPLVSSPSVTCQVTQTRGHDPVLQSHMDVGCIEKGRVNSMSL